MYGDLVIYHRVIYIRYCTSLGIICILLLASSGVQIRKYWAVVVWSSFRYNQYSVFRSWFRLFGFHWLKYDLLRFPSTESTFFLSWSSMTSFLWCFRLYTKYDVTRYFILSRSSGSDQFRKRCARTHTRTHFEFACPIYLQTANLCRMRLNCIYKCFRDFHFIPQPMSLSLFRFHYFYF